MINDTNNIDLVVKEQEWQSTKIFLILFYVVVFLYDFVYYILSPAYIETERLAGFPSGGIWVLMYSIFFLLLPIAILLRKNGYVDQIKYIYFFVFQILTFINDILVYWDEPYRSGNAFDVILVLISPIFFSKRFFWTVIVGIILKYVVVGFVLKIGIVFFPILLVILFMFGSLIIISRLQKYIQAVKDANEKVAQTERLAVIGQLSAGIAHEIKNPLSSIKGFLQLNKEQIEPSYYNIMVNEINRINQIATELLYLSKPKNNNFELKDLNNIINYSVDLLESKFVEKNIQLQFHTSDDLPKINCVETQLIQVFVNILKNSLEALDEGKEVAIKTSSSWRNVEITIKDNGPGIPREIIHKISDPFFTTKENGTGLGIMICKKIIEEHQGKFSISSEIDQGTTVTIILPKK